jgi:outer membrane autotransporter protein
VNTRRPDRSAQIASRSTHSDRVANHASKNRGRLLALSFGAYIWACHPCQAQLEVNAYITNRDSNSVSVVDTATNSVTSTLALGIGTAPIGLATTPDGRFAYVANSGTNTISVIDLATNKVTTAPISLGLSPFGVATSPDGKSAFITNNGSNTVSVFNNATNAVIALPVGNSPVGVAITPNGQFAYVTNRGSNTVSVINTATNVVASIPNTGGTLPEGIAVTPNGQFVYVANTGLVPPVGAPSQTVSLIDTATNTVVPPALAVGSVPVGVAITPDGKFAYVANEFDNTVSVIDTTSNTQVDSIKVGSRPFGVAITPNGEFVYVTNSGNLLLPPSNTVSVISTISNQVTATITVENSPFTFGSFIGPNIIVAPGGPLLVANDAALTALGFGNPSLGFQTFVDFNGGTLQTTGSLITSRTISLLPLGGTIDTNGLDSIFSGEIINSGSLTKIGTGTLALTGNNSYSGGTSVLGGVLSVSSDTNLGTGDIHIANGAELLTTGTSFDSGKAVALGNGGGTLASAEGGTASYGGVISGTGPLKIGDEINLGTIVLRGANTYSGGTTINGGILEIGADVNLGTASGGLTFNGGTLQTVTSFSTRRAITLNAAAGTFAPGAGTTFTEAGTITGVGGLTKTGAGIVLLGGNNNYSGGTIVVAGTLQAGSAGGFVNHTAYTVTGGTLDLNSFNLTMSSLNGTGGMVNLGSAALTVQNTGTDVYSGIIQGTGSLTKLSAGELVLSGNNTYAGGTLVNGGTLTVNSAQALGLGDVVVQGGVVRSDSQPINVKENYTQNMGGTLQLSLAGSGPGQYDFLNVGGRATLDGTLQLLFLSSFQPKIGDKLTLVLAADGVSGRFANFLNPFSSLINLELVYQPNAVLLEFASNFTAFAQTPNQMAVARQLDAVAFDPHETQLISFLQNQPLGNLAADFEKISPDSLSALYEISFSSANVQTANLENRFAEIRNGSAGFSSSLNISNSPGTVVESKDGKGVIEPSQNVLTPSPENKWGVWISGSGEFVNVASDGNGSGYDFTTGGVSLGLDYRLTKNLAVGLAAGYAHTWTSLTGDGSIDVNHGNAGVYATFFSGGFYLSGYVGGGYSSYETRRAALLGNANGSTDGGELNTFIGGGYEFHCGGWSFGPLASLQYTYVDINEFTESGSLAPLRIQSQSQDSLRTNLGLSASYTWQAGRVRVRPSVRASWQHEYLYSALPIDAQFASGAGSIFTVQGPALGHDSAVVDAGLDVQWTPTIGTYIGYNGQVGRSNYDSHAVMCNVHLEF